MQACPNVKGICLLLFWSVKKNKKMQTKLKDEIVVCQCVLKQYQQDLFSAEDQDSAHLFRPRMQQGIQIAIKTRALERCREMDLHPNSSRVLALTLLRIGSVSNSRKSSLLNCKPQYFNGYCKLSTNAQLRLLMPDVKILPISDFIELWNEHLFYLWSTSAILPLHWGRSGHTLTCTHSM